MRIEISKEDVILEFSWDEAVRFGVALNAGCSGLDEDSFLRCVSVPRSPILLVSRLLSSEAGRFVGRVTIIAESGTSTLFDICVKRTAESVSITMSRRNAQRLRAVVEIGFENAGSRAEYYLREGLSRPALEKVVTAFTSTGNGVVEIPLEWGEAFLEAPPRARTPRGTPIVTAWLVVRVDESGTRSRSFVVESAWLDMSDADREAVAHNVELQNRAIGNGRVWYEVKNVALTMRPKAVIGERTKDANVFLVGRVVGQDIGNEELLPGSLWWSESDARYEMHRWNELEAGKIASPYQVWPTWLRSEGA